MKAPQIAALFGFLFVVVWVRFDFGDAILCLLGAVIFYFAVAVYSGELDLGDIQQRAQARGSRL